MAAPKKDNLDAQIKELSAQADASSEAARKAEERAARAEAKLKDIEDAKAAEKKTAEDAKKAEEDARVKKHEFIVLRATWIGPHLRKEGEVITMTKAEAQYYVPHILKPKEGEG